MGFKIAEIREILGEAYTDDIGKKLVNLHRSVVDPLLDDLDTAKRDATKYKTEADKVPGLQKDLDEAKKGEDWKSKFEKAEKDLKDFKDQVARDAEAVKVKAAFKKLLIDEKISEKALDAVMNATDYSNMKLKDDGTLDSIDELKNDINTRWGGFKVSQRQRGADPETPPPGVPGGSDDSVRSYIRKLHEDRYGATPQK